MKNLEYLKNLNKVQDEAVSYLDGPLLIVAGAGSGKTKVLTSKIAHIIETKKAFQIRYWQSHSLIRLQKKCRIEY